MPHTISKLNCSANSWKPKRHSVDCHIRRQQVITVEKLELYGSVLHSCKKKLTLMTGSSKYSCQLILCRSSNLALLYCTYTVCALWEKDFHLRRSRPRLSSRPIRELSAALKGDDRSWSDWPLEKHTETPPAESVYLMLTIYSLVPKHAVLACPAIIIWFLLTFKLKGEHSWAFEVILNVFIYSKEMYFHW